MCGKDLLLKSRVVTDPGASNTGRYLHWERFRSLVYGPHHPHQATIILLYSKTVRRNKDIFLKKTNGTVYNIGILIYYNTQSIIL